MKALIENSDKYKIYKDEHTEQFQKRSVLKIVLKSKKYNAS